MVALQPSSLGLGAGTEFRLIERALAGAARAGRGVAVGPGDDAAVLDAGPLAISVDLSIEGVHFRREWMTVEEIGERATRAALSDLAAMAAEPVAVLLALGVDGESAADVVPRLVAGGRHAAEACGALVVGGDLARVPAGAPWVVDVVCLGAARRPVLRSGGEVGDALWVTGRLGGAAQAVRTWEQGGRPDAEALEAFLRPTPRVREARWLADAGVLHALIDLSDGLVGDAGHLAAASGLDLLVDAGALPIHPGVLRRTADRREAERLALAGGEDYELALLAPAGAVEALVDDFQGRFGIPLTRVGTAVAGPGEVRVRGHDATPHAFDHFAEPA
ncbi:MAG: thiamine-phosphate kinase [Gemmatimonadota bacterium]